MTYTKDQIKKLLTPEICESSNYIGKSGKKYPYKEWNNFGSGDRYNVKDLPKEDYPYTLEYHEPKLPYWCK